jgi:hypothetical protein
MRRGLSVFFLAVGVAFLVNAVFGRFIVLPGYLSSLEAGRGGIEAAARAVPAWKIVRYLLWAYSFKLGIFFAGIGALLRTSMSAARIAMPAGGGLVYLTLAYAPFPGPYPLFFGIGGGLITVLVVLILLRWAEDRERLEGTERKAADVRLVGYFFFAMASYNLCPLMGVKAFGLYPEKMIRFGLQAEAASFASRIMIELLLGWVFLFLSYRKPRHRAPGSRRAGQGPVR